MARIIVLDSYPLGVACSPASRDETRRFRDWIWDLRSLGALVFVPEIADYEVRRELVRAGKAAGIKRLENLIDDLIFVPITRAAMLKAADLWADIRRQGLPTAAPDSLDADCIVAAQALLVCGHGDVLTVATSNPGHLVRFGIDAREWEIIDPRRTP